jgi:acetylornithine deacetylase/succinyl-diaminopimelate desuccinylase-like protein
VIVRVGDFRRAARDDLCDFALPDDGAHVPDERFRLDHLELGTRTFAATLAELGARP